MARTPRSLRERGVFVDTSAFLALIASNDQYHGQARLALDRLRERRYFLYTSKYVIYESHAGILSTVGSTEARRFLQGMANSATRLVRVTEPDEKRAKQIVFTHRDKEYSLCDATSFSVMDRLGLLLALTFDHHFQQHGFSIPLPGVPWP